jgi:thiamine pyrophosphate-dependent acetolactate synthase large subunit-like protein
MAQTVADVLVGVLEQIGVKHIFGLIGDSLNPLTDAVRRSRIQWIGVRHEEGAALAAAGQAKLTGRLSVCTGTTGPGSNHLVAGLYEASRDHAPVLALSGDMPRKSMVLTTSRRPSPICCSVTSRSTPKQSPPRRRRRASFIRQLRLPMRAVASPT